MKTEKCCANIHDGCACLEGCGCTCYNCKCREVSEVIQRMLDRPPGVRHNHPPGTDHPDGIWGCHACAIKVAGNGGGGHD